MLPLASSVELATGTFLLLTLVGGVAFGVVLERAGFGSGCKLTAVFYGYDMSVVKGDVHGDRHRDGGTLAARVDRRDRHAGDLHRADNYAAQLIGGLVFGAGFVIGGYCPGTAVVACAAGRTDAWVFALGLLAGIAIYARYMSGVEQWIRANAIDDVTLPSLTGIATGWWVALFVVLLALAAWAWASPSARSRD